MTKGLGRWGAARAAGCNVSPEFARPWVAALTGIGRLVSLWHQALRSDPRPAFAQVPAELTVSPDDLAWACRGWPGRNHNGVPGGRARWSGLWPTLCPTPPAAAC